MRFKQSYGLTPVTANFLRGSCFGARLKFLLFQSRQDEIVDWVLDPIFFLHLRYRRTLRRFEGPMFVPASTFINPTLKQIDLFGRQFFARFRWRHDVIRISGRDAVIKLALSAFAG